MSAEQYQSFLRCEAATLATVNGEYTPTETEEGTSDKIVHMFYGGTLKKLLQEQPKMFTKKGELIAKYRQADYIVERAQRDSLFSLMMGGTKQYLRTKTINNMRFKILVDSFLRKQQCEHIVSEFPQTSHILKDAEGAMVKLKIVDSFDCTDQYREWVDEGAFYQNTYGEPIPFCIAAVTRELTPDIKILTFPQDLYDKSFKEILRRAKGFIDIKNGVKPPRRCEKCEYCKQTKKLTNIILEDFD